MSLALNGTNCAYLQSEAVLKLQMAQSLINPEWWIVGQYVLMPDSFDTNHLCRIFLPDPYVYQVPYWDPTRAFFRWVIEEWDPRLSTQPLINTTD